ncbi:MAG: HDOD domain-containing protein [Armatimonadetes bacterium]|nr:HDOD domain-containing protein [Armatimonadota bacterium]
MSAAQFDLSEDPVAHIVSTAKDVAVLPQVVFKILENTGSTEISAGELEKCIVVDPGFSAKVLAMANSAFFALPKRVTSIKEAIAFLGFKQVRTLAMNAGVFDLFVGKTDRESLRRRAWWRHSLDTANCSKWIAGHFHKLNPDEAYAAGLLHLIGRTIMDRSDPELYTTVMAAVDKGVPDLLSERHFFFCDHVDITEAVCCKWGLPSELVSAVCYSRPPKSDEDGFLRACVAVSHVIAGMAINGVGDDRPLSDHFFGWSLEFLNITSNLKEWVDAGIAAIASAQHAG